LDFVYLISGALLWAATAALVRACARLAPRQWGRP
jgi:hypothetical protein